MNMRAILPNIVREVEIEVLESTEKHGEFRGGHEGYAVILEELDELWEHVKGDSWATDAAYNEAKQVAAMGIKFMQMIVERRGVAV
jgi:hypothetical protein